MTALLPEYALSRVEFLGYLWYNQVSARSPFAGLEPPTALRLNRSRSMSNHTSTTVEIQIVNGPITVIDAIDADLAAFKWYAMQKNGKTYAWTKLSKGDNSKTPISYLHRIILQRMIEVPLSSKDITDHIDNNSLNNCRNNLRLTNKSGNAQNSRKHRDNTSGFKGVYWNKKTNRWIARITVHGKHLHVGTFKTSKEAHIAYCEAAKYYHGEFARFE